MSCDPLRCCTIRAAAGRTRRCFHKYEEAGNPVVPEARSPMFADEADRFKRNAAEEIRQAKAEGLKRQQVGVRARLAWRACRRAGEHALAISGAQRRG